MASQAKLRTKRCMIDGCKAKAAYRGLCRGCYRAAWREVKAGRTTWRDLEESGLVLPKAAHRHTAIYGKLKAARKAC